jgi:hypothetical protein
MNFFQTADLYLAAALKTSGFELINVQLRERKRGTFIFVDRPERPQVVRDYFAGRLTGSLKDFSNNWADLKSLINETMEMENDKNGRSYPKQA